MRCRVRLFVEGGQLFLNDEVRAYFGEEAISIFLADLGDWGFMGHFMSSSLCV